jgi:putative molybdopterin biosynthesis protein
MGKGSGSVTAFSRADGFVRIARNVELVEADSEVEVVLLGRALEPADLVVIGSHCTGLDLIAAALHAEGFSVKVLAVGSQGGLEAARRGECDAAPIHLLDAASGVYNRPFLDAGLELVRGYARMQGVVVRPEETRPIEQIARDAALRLVNRNRGSGTRVLIDELLAGRRPDGFSYEVRSHHAVAAAVAQRRADWGVAIESATRGTGLRFLPLRSEAYDFAVPRARLERPAVRALLRLLEPGSELRARLAAQGFGPPPE